MSPTLHRSLLLNTSVITHTSSGPSHIIRGFSSTPAQWRATALKSLSGDAYAKAQRKRFEAALALRRQLKAKQVDPQEAIHGILTPFVASLGDKNPSSNAESGSSIPPLNYNLSPDEIQSQLETSKYLLSPSKPLPVPSSSTEPVVQSDEAELSAREDARHSRAEEALKRIFALDRGSSSDRLHWNIKRCIETFGRHNTDDTLDIGTGTRQKHTLRIGKDTGSSEVQIAVLTAKIQGVARNFRNKDKSNKRNLRLMVHKRQKLLRYLEKKERGGPRWQNLVETLGLTDAAWKNQISL